MVELDGHDIRPQRRRGGHRRLGAVARVLGAGPRGVCRAEHLGASPNMTRGTTVMSVDYLGPYRVAAYNTAHDSENKIHDDATARRFGFGGGLVPGVDVYGYMSHLPVMRWGRAWLERGSAECRFFKPVYDGDDAIVTAREDGDALDIAVESRGEDCASGRAALPDAPPPLSLDRFRAAPQHADRPPA